MLRRQVEGMRLDITVVADTISLSEFETDMRCAFYSKIVYRSFLCRFVEQDRFSEQQATVHAPS